MRKLVEEAGDRPVLHCVRAAPGGRLMHERYAVERSVARAPELWPCIAGEPHAPLMTRYCVICDLPRDPRVTPPAFPAPADHLASAHPDVLLMVQRLASPALACRLSQESRACPEASCAPSLPALIVGEVDEECCHSVGDTHGHHHHHHQSAPRVVFDEESKVFRDAFRKSLEETASKRDTSAQYYGVVVQARSRAASWSGSGSAASALDSEGCYLLKASRVLHSGWAGCTLQGVNGHLFMDLRTDPFSPFARVSLRRWSAALRPTAVAATTPSSASARVTP